MHKLEKKFKTHMQSGDITSLAVKYPFLVPTSSAMADGGIARLGYANGEIVLDISDVNLDSKMKAAKKLSEETGMPIEKALEKIMADAFAEGVSIKELKAGYQKGHQKKFKKLLRTLKKLNQD